MQPVVRVFPRCLPCALFLALPALYGGCDGDDPVDPVVELEREVLLKFYDALGGSGWHRSDNWGTDASLHRWHGVTTDGEGNVIALTLRQNRLVGAIPAEIRMLGGLKSLDLCCGNSLTVIPPEIGNLQDLVHLHLQDSDLSGSIPPELSNCLQNITYQHVIERIIRDASLTICRNERDRIRRHRSLADDLRAIDGGLAARAWGFSEPRSGASAPPRWPRRIRLTR